MKALWAVSLAACVKAVPPDDPCAPHDRAVAAFRASLLYPADAPPAADPARSPALAQQMEQAAAQCLASRGVAFSATREGLWLEPRSSEVSRRLEALTNGRAVYSGAFFVEKPYAAASFDKATNTLFLPHAAVASDMLGPAVRHELRHAESLALLRQRPRARHRLLENASTRPDALSVDEIFAYAAVSTDPSVDAAEQSRSAAAARSYAAMVESALADTTTVSWIEAHPRSEAAPLSEAQKAELRLMLACVTSRFPAIEECDAQP